MSNVGAHRRKVGVKSPHDLVAKVCDFLREHHPQKTAEWVAAETGISTKTIGNWLDRSSAPGGVAMVHLTMAYGPDFLAAVMDQPPAWLSAARRAERAAAIEHQLAALQAERDAL